MAVLLGLVGKVKFAELHGNLSQQQRVKALADFESGRRGEEVVVKISSGALSFL